jgi:hypothetical protein
MEEPISTKDKKKERSLSYLLVLIFIVAVGVALWLMFGKNNDKQSENTANPTSPPPASTNKSSQVDSLVSYQLPDGWKSVGCNTTTDVVLIVPQGKVSPDCAALADNWPMKLMVDTMNTTDCNQIKVNDQQVTNHVCSSQSINGSKFLVASTTFNDKSPYGKKTKVSEYYVKTSGGVVKLQYADDLTSNEDDYQAQFDQIANSIKVK